MKMQLLQLLVDESSRFFKKSGPFAYHYARGKLSSDCFFREMLVRGLLPATGRYLDLGCGQGSLFAWLLSARKIYESGAWPADMPDPPKPESMRGVELMQNDVDRAAQAFGKDHPVVRIEQGDMNHVDFGRVNLVTILDALHYFDHEHQVQVLKRIHAALLPGGVFLTRIGDASAGWPVHFSNWVDHVVTFARGHRLPRLYCRSLADWTRLLEEVGFSVESDAMSEGKPFANVMLICRVQA
jgi:SAM-dependent methyltransferase